MNKIHMKNNRLNFLMKHLYDIVFWLEVLTVTKNRSRYFNDAVTERSLQLNFGALLSMSVLIE